MARNKVASACNRCRRQKIKCDTERPCLLCSRAGVECVTQQPQIWQMHVPGQAPRKHRKTRGAKQNERTGQQSPPSETAPRGVEDPGSSNCTPTDEHEAGGGAAALPTIKEPWTNSSSTIMLVEEAFRHHDIPSPIAAETSSLRYSHDPRHPYPDANRHQSLKHHAVANARSSQIMISRSLALELASLLPSASTVAILIENYFDKIHWFMLLFHQREFRRMVNDIYNVGGLQTAATRDVRALGFMSVLLAVCALSLQYLSPRQIHQLLDGGVDPQLLKERILTSLRLRLLDVVALGSLEAVQMCVLLGSYYLHHGKPELAWPVCGCALRLAQALELHRRPASAATGLSSNGSPAQQIVEDRKRCWWAIHEVEIFCSMVYGFPLSISDADCDVESLDPLDPWSIAADAQPLSTSQPTLLAYKCSMANLSKIVKSGLQDLYGSRQTVHRYTNGPFAATEGAARFQALIRKVTSLDQQLSKWYSDLPQKLRMKKLGEPTQGRRSSHHDNGTKTSDPASPATSFDEQLFQLQALVLKLTFENSRILIHRPLLSCKATDSADDSAAALRKDPFGIFIHACRDAALQISWAGHTPIFKEASTTYALNFISLHLLTAGATLCIMTSLDPLGPEAYEQKLGIRRLMEIQAALKPHSIVADQGMQLLTKLLSLVMKKETHKMFDFGSQSPRSPSAAGAHEVECPDLNVTQGLSGQGNAASEKYKQETITLNPWHRTGTGSQVSSSPDVLHLAPSSHDLSLDFHEDLLVTQAMLDFEQAMSQAANNTLMTSDMANPGSGQSCIGQDQGWIWGATMDACLTDWTNNTTTSREAQ